MAAAAKAGEVTKARAGTVGVVGVTKQQTTERPAVPAVSVGRRPSWAPLAIFFVAAGCLMAFALRVVSGGSIWLDQLVTGPSGNELALRVSGTLSSLGNTEGQTAAAAVAMAALCSQKRFGAAAYIWTVVIVAGFSVRTLKATVTRERPLPRESEYFLDPMLRRSLLLALLVLVAVWWLSRRRPGSAMWLGVLLPLAFLVDRSTRIIPVTGELASFPSGHAANSAAATSAILITWWAGSQSRGRIAMATAAALTVGVGCSRVVLGYHHVSDVLAGWCLTLAIALGLRYLFGIAGLIPTPLDDGTAAESSDIAVEPGDITVDVDGPRISVGGPSPRRRRRESETVKG